jgi:hypothetical protein
MQTATITFVETMRGQVVMTRFVTGAASPAALIRPDEEDAGAIAASLRQGVQRDLALPMIWGDLAIAVANHPRSSALAWRVSLQRAEFSSTGWPKRRCGSNGATLRFCRQPQTASDGCAIG